MSFDPKKGFCFCERCGHDWQSKPIGDKFKEPRSCAKCKSKVWNHPRVYSGKYVSGTLAKRFKPTGRAAARIKHDPEETRRQKIEALMEQMTPEERLAATKMIIIYELAAMLDELGLR